MSNKAQRRCECGRYYPRWQSLAAHQRSGKCGLSQGRRGDAPVSLDAKSLRDYASVKTTSPAPRPRDYDTLAKAAARLPQRTSRKQRLPERITNKLLRNGKPVVSELQYGKANTYHGYVAVSLIRVRDILSRSMLVPGEPGEPYREVPFDINRAAKGIQELAVRIHEFNPSVHHSEANVYSQKTKGLAAKVVNKEWSSAAGDGVPDYFLYDPSNNGYYYLNKDVRSMLLSADRDLRSNEALERARKRYVNSILPT